MFLTGVNDTGDDLFTGENDTSKKLLPESLLLAINLNYNFSLITGASTMIATCSQESRYIDSYL
jgi:hypothetical protein